MTGGQKLYHIIFLAQKELGLHHHFEEPEFSWKSMTPINQRAFEITALTLDFEVDEETIKASCLCMCNLDGEDRANRVRENMFRFNKSEEVAP